MKRIILLSIIIALTTTLKAQYATPRTGTGTGNDNTYRALNFRYLPVTDATGNDTVKLNLNAYHTSVSLPALTDSITFNFTSVANCYLGDEVVFTVKNTSGGTKVKFGGSNYQVGSGGSVLTLTASKRATIKFVFDGTTWLEAGRLVQ
jgi:hypothetical protein